jgi:glycogen debranching enzyme GlgX/4-alpha-glucanotransferase
MDVSEGTPEPLGASADARGVNFAVFSAHATAINVSLFDAAGAQEVARIRLPARTGDVWHGHVAGLAPGARYGLRAEGPWAPEAGHRFDAAKLLLDPYAVALDRRFELHPSMLEHGADTAAAMPKAIVAEPLAAAPAGGAFVPWEQTVIYELHVRGFSIRNPAIPEALRGTFAALAAPASIAHLRRLGVTAVEIMPAAAWIDEPHLVRRGLSNAWGYNPAAFLVPEPKLAPGGWAEVRTAVGALAAAGIETIVDVVLNHSGEGDAHGPTIALRGLDNATYYHLLPGGAFVDDTGTGNTLALDRPPVLHLAMEALRAWALRGGVHGFRFDLATTLGRRGEAFDPAAPLLAAIDQDPVLRRLKRIAEPWDVGPGGYQLGAFPGAWGEWNDRFRDGVRRFWRGDADMLGELATRLAGSADVFATKRRPSRSINFITAHDGFTLADLVSYARRHNEANGETNHDGAGENHSWNNGVEGPSEDPAILAARARDQRVLLASLLLARGTPMLAMGAELGRTQGGNNNAYAQDNAIGWIDWERADAALIGFVERLAAFRAVHPALHADRFLTGAAPEGGIADVAWQTVDGRPMRPADWDRAATLVVVFFERGDRVALVLSRSGAPVTVTLPPPREGFAWELAISTADARPPLRLERATVIAPPRAVLALAETAPGPARPAATGSGALARLAAAAGIAPEWWDIEGRRHAVSPETTRALLAAMRLPAATEAEARESLERFAETHQRRALPHALVIAEGTEATLPMAPGIRQLVLEGEDGTQEPLVLAAASEVMVPCADGRSARVQSAALPRLPPGRWRIWAETRPDCVCTVIVAPRTCFLPPALAGGGRRFGLAAHLYSLRREGDQGIGDFTTLGVLGREAARAGAAVLGLSPLHMLFPGTRERASPYHPSDRRFLDPLYIDVAGEEGGLAAAPARARLAAEAERIAALSAAPMLDYEGVWAAKRAVLEAAFAAFDAADPAGAALAEFRAYGGVALQQFAIFQAIAEQYSGDWRGWPPGLRAPDAPGIAAFAASRAMRVRFHLWLQWLADRQFAAARAAAGLEIGFYRDLAVGCAPDGAEAWGGAEVLALGASVGAPPDPFSPAGQVWHVPPPDPWRLRADGFARLAGLFGANMRHAGALRIDHAMALTRLFWVPEGGTGADGAYVAYPLEAMLGVLALESRRARTLVVGEDLGTVPEGLRERLGAADVLSYRVLWFERDGAAFRRPEQYPVRAVACVSTHDLPTLAGWRAGADVEERAALGLLDATAAKAARAERAEERASLAAAVGGEPTAGAVHTYLAATPSALVLAQADDLAGETMALNLPGTDRERPNWRRRIATPVPSLLQTPAGRAIIDRLRPGRTA